MHFTGSGFWRFLPLVHAGVFGATAVVGRILIARTNKHNAVSFSRGESARDFVARCFYLWLPVIDGLFVVFYAMSGERGQLAARLFGLEWTRWIGVVCMVIALVWVVCSQAAMGTAWRMGVDSRMRTELITTGPFAVSRNPIYLGIRATILGQLLVVGTWHVLMIWAMSELLVQIQVRFEEEHMFRLHAKRYAEYCSRVRRWL
ncbi:isoprenylcysteine carboxylmethyltransferase family protein [Paraburkholderia sp. LEh10]|jgi:protein-S-isoprenylcysteine O-methyltransferase Ste14|uniref:methyltransferase family protein n=1 Tax=Paraburkholderia sp. LEh10 TaxID=2821353 RepID=UPI001AE4DD98|nr:isoprenylcysteine carboxylmethyltransferase family protein [Paraburkholderia sp. LEh10]MBP0592056.1 isoprenylcysteine carboxylmethyltransferase family protein [Paraburkholderia sp. LEh10]